MRYASRTKAMLAALAVIALAALGLAGTASAKLTGPYEKFAQCPFTNLEVAKCLYAVTESGEVTLGNKEVPIEKPVVLQGGYGFSDEEGFAQFYGATNGVTLSEVPQNVPGGLAGLVNCKKITEFILKAACEFTFENGLTGVTSTLVLAKPASAIRINEKHLAEREGIALELPVKFRLENPLLGSECYVGSNSSPIIWKLTSGTTSPPPPNTPISGSSGKGTFLEEGRIIEIKEVKMVDNAWSAPGASGCGGLFAFLLDPIINSSAGLPSAAGHNTAILNNTLNVGAAGAVERNNEENP